MQIILLNIHLMMILKIYRKQTKNSTHKYIAIGLP